MNESLFALLDKSFASMVSIRRHLHQYPELSFHEKETAVFIQNFYRNLGIDYRKGVGGNGIVARVEGGRPGKTVALRADFDALPIQDEKDVPYKSTVQGVMHACGHDGHTSILLHLAKAIHEIRDNLSGNYVFIHQHAEEYAPGGAISMIEDGCLENVDAIFGTHLWSLMEANTIQYASGPIMAAADRIEISVKGSGGHGAAPHQTKDAIVIASQFVTNLQQLVSRRVDPLESAVVSIGSFISENAFNVIANEAVLLGTVRTFSPTVREHMEKEIQRIADGTAIMHEAEIDVVYTRGYPPVRNHIKETEFIRDIAANVPGVKAVIEMMPQMGGEDFAYYLEKVPGTFFFTGAKPTSSAFPHHHPLFDFDESAMLTAAKTLGAAALQYQQFN